MITILTIIIVLQFIVIAIMYYNIRKIIKDVAEDAVLYGQLHTPNEPFPWAGLDERLAKREEKISPKPNPKPNK